MHTEEGPVTPRSRVTARKMDGVAATNNRVAAIRESEATANRLVRATAALEEEVALLRQQQLIAQQQAIEFEKTKAALIASQNAHTISSNRNTELAEQIAKKDRDIANALQKAKTAGTQVGILEDTIRDQNQSIKKQQDQIADLQKQVSKIAGLETENARLVAQHTTDLLALETHKQTIKALQDELRANQAELLAQGTLFENEKGELTVKNTELQNKLAKSEALALELQGTIHTQSLRILELEKQVSDLQGQLEIAHLATQKALEEKAIAITERDAARATVADLTGKLATSEAEKNSAMASAAQLQATIDTLTTQRNHAHAQVAEAERNWKAATDQTLTDATEIARLALALKSAQDQVSTFSTSLIEKTTQLESAQQKISALDIEIQSLKQTVKEQAEKIETLQKRISDLESENADLKKQLQAQILETQARDATIAERDLQLLSLTAQKESAIAAAQKAEADKREAENVLQEAEQTIAGATSKIAELESQIQQSQTNNQALKNELIAQKKLLETATGTIDTLTSNLQDAIRRADEENTRAKALQKQVDQLTKELAEARSENEALKKTLAQQTLQIHALEEANRQILEQKGQVDQQLAAVQREAASTANQLHTAEGKIAELTETLRAAGETNANEKNRIQALLDAEITAKEKLQRDLTTLRQSELQLKATVDRLQVTVQEKTAQCVELSAALSASQTTLAKQAQIMQEATLQNQTLVNQNKALTENLQRETAAKKQVETRLSASEKQLKVLTEEKTVADREYQEKIKKLDQKALNYQAQLSALQQEHYKKVTSIALSLKTVTLERDQYSTALATANHKIGELSQESQRLADALNKTQDDLKLARQQQQKSQQEAQRALAAEKDARDAQALANQKAEAERTAREHSERENHRLQQDILNATQKTALTTQELDAVKKQLTESQKLSTAEISNLQIRQKHLEEKLVESDKRLKNSQDLLEQLQLEQSNNRFLRKLAEKQARHQKIFQDVDLKIIQENHAILTAYHHSSFSQSSEIKNTLEIMLEQDKMLQQGRESVKIAMMQGQYALAIKLSKKYEKSYQVISQVRDEASKKGSEHLSEKIRQQRLQI